MLATGLWDTELGYSRKRRRELCCRYWFAPRPCLHGTVTCCRPKVGAQVARLGGEFSIIGVEDDMAGSRPGLGARPSGGAVGI